jgi:hypothetical protein
LYRIGGLIKLRRTFYYCTAAAVCALSSAKAADLPVSPAISTVVGSPPEATLAVYQAMSDRQSRNYDRVQDISPRQMLILLEVCERAGASLGQALATGELESAYTWNDHVRPTLNNGNLGSATGVWQFVPATFHRIVKLFGSQLLAATEADTIAGRERLDLGEGPFTDAQVRSLIQEAVDGKRGDDDKELQLLRHNFAVLAFAKHYLSRESGAATPEEDYLYHFLGEGQGRRVLALARGQARDTLSVQPAETPDVLPETKRELAAVSDSSAAMKAGAVLQAASLVAAESALVSRANTHAPPRGSPTWGLATQPWRPTLDVTLNAGIGLHSAPLATAEPRLRSRLDPYAVRRFSPRRGDAAQPQQPALNRRIATINERSSLQATLPMATDSAVWFSNAPETPPRLSSAWGLPADSPTVTGNLGMFYRDGKGQTQPYTWAEFMDNLARRVRAKDQPALVRAKYGVGFELKGGDMPERLLNPTQVPKAVEFRHEISGKVLLPEALVIGPLSTSERRWYRNRLAELVSRGEDHPMNTLPPETLSTLHHLRLLLPDVPETSTANPEVQKTLRNFRKMVGKDEPDDPAHLNSLMPAERLALEIYDQRLARYAAIQAGQQASVGDAVDLKSVRTMPTGLQKSAAPHIAVLQAALADKGLLTQPTQKNVWRDKKRKRHVEYKTVPFTGTAGKTTVAALNSFQLRNGLRKTDGVADALTLAMLGLPPMGAEIFLPLSGPHCPIGSAAETAPMCAILTKNKAMSALSVDTALQHAFSELILPRAAQHQL